MAGIFDFDENGKLDFVEQAAEFSAFTSIMDNDEEEVAVTELELSGLDLDDLEDMEEEEREEALEDAGLDFDDFDF